MRVRLVDVAQEHVQEGYEFYDKQESGLGEYFLDSLITDLLTLENCAGVHAKVFGYHRCICDRFPFAIYYLVTHDEVEVRAILDCRRNPAWIRRQLRRI